MGWGLEWSAQVQLPFRGGSLTIIRAYRPRLETSYMVLVLVSQQYSYTHVLVLAD